MSTKSRQEFMGLMRERYKRRGRKGRSRLLDEVCEMCEYDRKYAIKLLGGRRAIAGARGMKRGGSRPRYGEEEGRRSKRSGWRLSSLAASGSKRR